MSTKREENTAKNKRALVDALLMRLKREAFQDIKISALCRDAGVSPASFYNYFPHKEDMIVYFIQLWSLESSWYAQRDSQEGGGLSLIEGVYKRTAVSLREHPEIMGEIIAFQAKRQMPQEWPHLTDSEKKLAFPKLEGIENIEAKGLDGILIPNIQLAIAQGELPQTVSVETVLIALTSLFFGIPMLLHVLPPEGLEQIFGQQLALIWAGAKSL